MELFSCGNCNHASTETEWKRATRQYGNELRKSLESIINTDREIICPHCFEVMDGYRIQKK